MFTKKFVKRSFKFKFHVKVWSCNRPLTVFLDVFAKEIRSKQNDFTNK